MQGRDFPDLSVPLFRLRQHSMQEQGARSVAASYIGLERPDGTMFWGAGTDTDVVTANTKALLSAFCNMTKGDVR